MQLIECDHCGKQQDLESEEVKLRWREIRVGDEHEYDVCEMCMPELLNFLEPEDNGVRRRVSREDQWYRLGLASKLSGLTRYRLSRLMEESLVVFKVQNGQRLIAAAEIERLKGGTPPIPARVERTPAVQAGIPDEAKE